MLTREDVWKEGWTPPLVTRDETEEEAVKHGCRYFYKKAEGWVEKNLWWECIVYEWRDQDYSYIRLSMGKSFHMCFFPKNVKDFRKLMKLLNIK